MYSFLLKTLPTITRRKRPSEEVFAQLENSIYNMLLLSYLLGFVHVTELARGEVLMAQAEPLTMEEAVELFKTKVPLQPEEFKALEGPLRLRAFTVSRLVGMDAIVRTKEAITKALEEGQTLQGFIETVGADAVIRKAGFDVTSPFYWETVFRTNVMSAYSAGRWAAIERNGDAFSHLEYLTIPDERRCPICGPLHGIVRRKDDDFWRTHYPPLHFNCRCVVRPIHRVEARRDNIRSSRIKADSLPEVPQGFGSPVHLGELPQSMLDRAREYGLLDDIERLAERLGVQ